MTVSNEKIDYILKQRVWQHSFNTAVTSQNNLIRRIFGLAGPFVLSASPAETAETEKEQSYKFVTLER